MAGCEAWDGADATRSASAGAEIPVMLVLGRPRGRGRPATVRRARRREGCPAETLGWDDLAEQLAIKEVRERRVS